MAFPHSPIDLLLCLDFDGVLSPGNTGTLRYAEPLAEVLDAHGSVAVLLTTNWRDTHSPPELLEWLPARLSRRVVGQAPRTPHGDSSGGRQREIELWARGRHIRKLLALDDVASLYSPGWRHLHLVDGRSGLDREEMGRFLGALERAPAWSG
jgi:hypothetical protein